MAQVRGVGDLKWRVIGKMLLQRLASTSTIDVILHLFDGTYL